MINFYCEYIVFAQELHICKLYKLFCFIFLNNIIVQMYTKSFQACQVPQKNIIYIYS